MFVGEEGERSKLCIVLKAIFSVLYIKRVQIVCNCYRCKLHLW